MYSFVCVYVEIILSPYLFMNTHLKALFGLINIRHGIMLVHRILLATNRKDN